MGKLWVRKEVRGGGFSVGEINLIADMMHKVELKGELMDVVHYKLVP